MIKILYVHGFGSHYDPHHEKVKKLQTLGEISGVDVEYCNGFDVVEKTIKEAAFTVKPDLLIGTGIGGHAVAAIGAELGIPFVAMNPIIKPSKTMKQWIGNFTDSVGHDHYLNESVCASYPDMVTEGNGLVIIESGDEISSATKVENALTPYFKVKKFVGGSHRFVHIDAALPIIKEFIEQSKKA